MNLAAIFRRLDAAAHEQLCAEAARLAVENEQLRAENEQLHVHLRFADIAAESWRDDALRLSEEIHTRGGQVAMTIDGRLHGSLPT